MDRVGAGVARGVEQFVRREVGIVRGAITKAVRLVGLGHVQAARVGVGIDGDALHAHRAQRALDTAGDGAAIGNQEFLEHSIGLEWRAVPR